MDCLYLVSCPTFRALWFVEVDQSGWICGALIGQNQFNLQTSNETGENDENDEAVEDKKAGDNEVENWAWVRENLCQS